MQDILSNLRAKLSQPKSVIGLDIGTHSIKMVQFAVIEGELSLVRVGLKEIELSEEEKDSPKAILDCLKEVMRGLDLKRARVVSVVNCPKSSTRKLLVPYMPKAEMAEAIKWEMKDHISFSIDEAIIDFEVFGEVMEKGVKKHEVLVAAAPEKTIVEHLDMVSQVRIKPSSITQVPLALRNLAKRAGFKEDETVALVEIGGSVTELCIFKGGAIEFSRKLPVAGRDITKAMTGVLVSDLGRVELRMNEAEVLKKEWGIPKKGETHIIDKKVSTDQVLSLIRPSVEKLSNEINRSFDYYREESRGGMVDRVVLFGGSAGLKGLTEFLANELGIEVEVGDPLKWVKVLPEVVSEKEAISYRLGVAIGAALSEAKGINLLPIERKEETKRLVERAGIKAVVTAVVLILCFLYIGMRLQLVGYNKKISVGKIELVSLRPQFEEAREQIQINQIFVNEPYWGSVLKEISNVVAPNIYLTKLSMEQGKVTVRGIILARAREEAAEQTLSGLMLALEKGIFKNVTLVTTRKSTEKEGSEFELRCEID